MQNFIFNIGREVGLEIFTAKFRKPLLHIAIGIAVLMAAPRLIEGVVFHGAIKDLLIVGSVLGLVNLLLKPVLNILTFPLRLITLGLFGFVVNMVLIWVVDIMFPEFDVVGIIPLFWTAILLWVMGFVVPILLPKRRPRSSSDVSQPKL